MTSKLKYPQKDATQYIDSNLLGLTAFFVLVLEPVKKAKSYKAVRLQMELFSGRIDMAVHLHYFQTASCL